MRLAHWLRAMTFGRRGRQPSRLVYDYASDQLVPVDEIMPGSDRWDASQHALAKRLLKLKPDEHWPC
jgi:hypothetical protein